MNRILVSQARPVAGWLACSLARLSCSFAPSLAARVRSRTAGKKERAVVT